MECTQYFTGWALMVHAGVALGLWPTNGTCLAVVVSLAGAYLTYVRPRALRVRNRRVDGATLRLADLLTHQLPLVYLCASNGGRLPPLRIGELFLLLVYLWCFDVEERYRLTWIDQLVVGLTVMLVV